MVTIRPAERRYRRAVAHPEFLFFGLLVAVAGLVVLAGLLRVPYPVMLVVGGLGLGFVPGVPTFELDPDLVLLLFLPPLLYSAAFFSSLRDLRGNLRPISFLSIGLVLATTFGVATVAHFVLHGVSWPVALVLGAIVSPTDPVTATAIARRLGIPRRIVAIVEGESLVNDGTALIAYRFAAAGVVTGTFSAWQAGLQFVLGGIGGIAVGLLVGSVVAGLRRRLDDSPVEITISLFTAFAAYLPAEELGFSGVLAAVTVGIYLGWRAPELTTATTRMQSNAVWEILIFLLNSTLFVLIGLQLPPILDRLSGQGALELVGGGLVVAAAVMGIRLVWVFGFSSLARWGVRRGRDRDPLPPWQWTLLVGWTGMRGAVSLAAALSIPLTVAGGGPFPQRDLVIFLVFAVILCTLLLQGLTLPVLVRALGVEGDQAEEAEEVIARLRTAEAAIARMNELQGEDWVREDTAERMHGLYDYRRRRFAAQTGVGDGDGVGEGEDFEGRTAAYQRLRIELLASERRELVSLRGQGHISDEVMRRVERDLDLEESRLGPPADGQGVSRAAPPSTHANLMEDARAMLQRGSSRSA